MAVRPHFDCIRKDNCLPLNVIGVIVIVIMFVIADYYTRPIQVHSYRVLEIVFLF